MSVKSGFENLTLKFFSSNLPKWNRIFLLKMGEKIRLKQRKHLRLDIHLADHCNLNCGSCEHMSPLAEEKFLSLEVFERDMKRLYELTDGYIEEISLLGGEPLLHPQIIDCVNMARKYFKKSRIQIATNGILLQNQSELFWKTLKKNNIRICISVYPIKIDHTKIKQIGKKYKIEIIYWGNLKQKNKIWEKMPIDIHGTQAAYESFRLCYAANYCIQLVDGKIYPCFRVAYIQYFNRKFNLNLEVCEKDFIDIYKCKHIKNIFEFLCKPVPFCRYCDMKKTVYTDWDISKKEINEWV